MADLPHNYVDRCHILGFVNAVEDNIYIANSKNAEQMRTLHKMQTDSITIVNEIAPEEHAAGSGVEAVKVLKAEAEKTAEEAEKKEEEKEGEEAEEGEDGEKKEEEKKDEKVRHELNCGVQQVCLRDIKRGPLGDMDSINRTVMLTHSDQRASISQQHLPRTVPGGCGQNIARAAAWLLPTTDFTRNVETHAFVGQDGDSEGKIDDIAKNMKDRLQIQGKWVDAHMTPVAGKRTSQCIIIGDEFSGSKALKNHVILMDPGASVLDAEEKEPIDALEKDALKKSLSEANIVFVSSYHLKERPTLVKKVAKEVMNRRHGIIAEHAKKQKDAAVKTPSPPTPCLVLVLNNQSITDELSKKGDNLPAYSLHSDHVTADEKLLVTHPQVNEEGEVVAADPAGALTTLWSCVRMVVGNQAEIHKLASNLLDEGDITKIEEDAKTNVKDEDEEAAARARGDYVLKELLKKISHNGIFDNSPERSKRMVVCTNGTLSDPLVCIENTIFTAPLEVVPDEAVMDCSGVGDAFAGGLLAQLQLYYEKADKVEQNLLNLKLASSDTATFHGVEVNVVDMLKAGIHCACHTTKQHGCQFEGVDSGYYKKEEEKKDEEKKDE